MKRFFFTLVVGIVFLSNISFGQSDTTKWTIYDSIPELDSNLYFTNTFLEDGRNICIDSVGKKYIISQFYGLASYNDTTWRRIGAAPLVSSDFPYYNNYPFLSDRKGNCWFVGIVFKKSALIKYDGLKYTIYDSLHGDEVTALAIDRYDNLIIGFQNRISNNQNSYTYSFSKYNVNKGEWNDFVNSNFINSRINCFHIDVEDNIWIGTDYGVTLLRNGVTWHRLNSLIFGVAYINTQPIPSVRSIISDAYGMKWLATSDGVWSFDYRATFIGSNYANGNYYFSNRYYSGLSSQNIFSLAIDNKGNKWFGTDAGLAVLFDSSSTTETFPFPKNPYYWWFSVIKSLSIDINGSVWFFFEGSLYNLNYYRDKEYSLPPRAIIYPKTDVSFCEGDSSVLSAYFDENYSYQWYLNDDLIKGATKPNLKVYTSGFYSVRVSKGLYHKMSMSTKVTAFQFPSGEIEIIGDTILCQGKSVTLANLDDNGQYTISPIYNWNSNDKNANNSSIIVTKSGEYYLDITINGCTKRSRSISIKVVPDIPEINTLDGDKSFCIEDSNSIFLKTKYDLNLTYLWYKNDTIIQSANQNYLEVFKPARYTVKLIQGKCTARNSVYVGKKSKLILSSGFQVCEGDTIGLFAFLNPGDISQISWDNNIKNQQKFVPIETKTYKVNVSDYYGCKYEDSIKITVNKYPNVKAIASKQIVCYGENVIFSGTGADYYVWDKNVINLTSFMPSSTDTYTVKGERNGCADTDTINVRVLTLPIVSASFTKLSVCFGEQTILKGFGASTYLWDNNVIDGTSFKPNETKTYAVIGIDTNGCTSSYFQEIKVFNLPEVLIVSSAKSNNVCEGDNLILSSDNLGSYFWSSGEVTSTIYPKESGVYTLSLKDVNGCIGVSNSLKITINPQPNVSITANGPLNYCDNQLTELISTIGVNYLWNDGSITSAIKPKYSGEYFVKVTDINGCSSTSSIVSVNVEKCSSINDNELASPQIYPNPTKGIIHIKNLTTGDLLNISDINGRVIYTQSIDSPTINLSMSDFSEQGVYYLGVFDKNRIVQVYKVVFN